MIRRARVTTGMLLLAISGCGEGRAPQATEDREGKPVYGGTAVVAALGDLDHLNALVSTDIYTQELLRYALFLPLVRYGPHLEYEPVLARSWDEDGDTAVVFHLRRDVRWHDGEPTTANDVAFTFRRAQDPRTTFPHSEYFTHWRDVQVVDSFTVRFRLEPHAEPMAGLPFLPVMPRHLLDSIAPERMASAAFNKRPVGNGPFRFVEYRPNDRWTFEANPDFPSELGGRPFLDRLVLRVIPDGTAHTIELRTGRVDLSLGPRAEQFAALDSTRGLRGIVRRSRHYALIAWNGRRPPFQDARVRRALTMAVDRQKLIDVLRAGHGQVAVGPVGRFHWAYDTTMTPLPYDPAAARVLLREAGVVDGDGDGIAETPAGRPFRVELKYQAGSPLNRDMAELIQADLRAIGVDVRPRAVEWRTLQDDLTSRERRFDAALIGWSSDFRLEFRDLFHSEEREGLFQFAYYANPEMDTLIEGVARARDRDTALPLLHRLQVLMRAEQPWSFLYYYPDLFVVNDRLNGVEMDERGTLISVARWWIPAQHRTRRPAEQPRSDSTARSPSPTQAPAR